MARLFNVVRQSLLASAFVPDAMMAMSIVVLALALLRILGLG
jgi:hypothetical protein